MVGQGPAVFAPGAGQVGSFKGFIQGDLVEGPIKKK